VGRQIIIERVDTLLLLTIAADVFPPKAHEVIHIQR